MNVYRGEEIKNAPVGWYWSWTTRAPERKARPVPLEERPGPWKVLNFGYYNEVFINLDGSSEGDDCTHFVLQGPIELPAMPA